MHRRIMVIFNLIFDPEKGGLSIGGHELISSIPFRGGCLFAF
jgi:hypothetical protein